MELKEEVFFSGFHGVRKKIKKSVPPGMGIEVLIMMKIIL